MKEHGSGLAGGPFPAGSAVPTPVAQRRVPPFVGVLVSVGMLGAAACAAGLGGGESDLGSPAPGRLLPGQVFRDCDVCPEMVVVPPGSYMMGSPEDEVGRYFNEEPRHLVRIAHSFAVGVHEVTFIEWDACVAAGGCGDYSPEDMGWGRGSRPVIHVSWEDAWEYARWLSRETGEEYRLLSEAEWEYVARAGTTTARYWGESESAQCRYGNGYDSTADSELGLRTRRGGRVPLVECSDRFANTAPVAAYRANAFGIHDMLGNVWEWTEDCWNGAARNWRNLDLPADAYLDAPADGSAWLSGDCDRRVLRGGS